MKKVEAVRFKPMIDWSTWGLIALVLISCGWPVFLDPGWLMIAVLSDTVFRHLVRNRWRRPDRVYVLASIAVPRFHDKGNLSSENDPERARYIPDSKDSCIFY